MNRNIMVDLETLGKSPDGVIVSIGAVVFDNEGLYDDFYEVVDIGSCGKLGLKFDASTIEWWLGQSDEALDVFKKKGRNIKDVLGRFREFVGKDEAKVWGNGSLFDNCILTTAYKLLGEDTPWGFRGDMCYRTVKNLAPEIKIQRAGVHHNALDDAKSQASHLIEIAKHLNIKL